jgi:uncharacterized protein YebE (UPF0316 family)
MIFVLRLLDVSMATIRIIFIAKGYKKLAPLIGFFEVLIWLFAISKVMANLDNWVCYTAFAAGFAAGNYVGILLENKLAIGHELIRVITKKEAFELIDALKVKGFGTTTLKATGINGEVAVIYIIVNRKHLNIALGIIKHFNPQALYTIEDIRSVNQEIFHGQSINGRKNLLKAFSRK